MIVDTSNLLNKLNFVVIVSWLYIKGRIKKEILHRWFFLPCFFVSFLGHSYFNDFGEAQVKEAVFPTHFFFCTVLSGLGWIPVANLVQLLTLDQVPEITGPTLFLWVEVISPGSRNTDLESVIRLSWPQHDQKKKTTFFCRCLYCYAF